MKFGLSRRYFRSLGNFGVLRFNLIRFLYGFDSANNYLKRANKYAVIPILKFNKATIGKLCDIEAGLTFHNCKDYSNLTIGDNCHIGKNCFFDLKKEIIVGNNVTISMNTSLITHQDFGKSRVNLIYKPQDGGIQINDNVYIGTGSTILMGVSIGKCSIIGARSLVNKIIDEHVLAFGCPAQKKSIIREK